VTHIPRRGKTRNASRTLVGRPEGKMHERSRRRCEDKLKPILNKQGENMVWIQLAEDKAQRQIIVNRASNLRVP